MSKGTMIKTKQRVVEHGEVFTPPHIVEAMLDLVPDLSSDPDARVLEPACGNGNFLVAVLRRKLVAAHTRSDRRTAMLRAVASIYGIDLLADNVAESKDRMYDVVCTYAPDDRDLCEAARAVIDRNVICGNTLTGTTPVGDLIIISEWVIADEVQRRDFIFRDLGRPELPLPVWESRPVPISAIPSLPPVVRIPAATASGGVRRVV